MSVWYQHMMNTKLTTKSSTRKYSSKITKTKLGSERSTTQKLSIICGFNKMLMRLSKRKSSSLSFKLLFKTLKQFRAI